ncbi:MAG: hypothetical protein JWQ43_2362 [Glaciihabitans sp.]|nr:hypothetical protein [Glaciihabitans sp.]
MSPSCLRLRSVARPVIRNILLGLLAVALLVPVQLAVQPTAAEAAAKSFTTSTAPKITFAGKTTFTSKPGLWLTAVVPTWTPAASATTLQWKRNGTAIKGATGRTYTLTAADVSTTITVTVKGAKSGYVSTSKTSAKTSNVGFKNCTELRKVYPHGVGKVGAKDNVKNGVTTFTRDNALYAANIFSDRDKDGIACEWK